MRLKLTLSRTQGSEIPLNYQYEISSWIYKTLHNSNPCFTDWLHSKGYSFQNKQYKLFTFSRMAFEKYTINNDRLKLQADTATLLLSFQVDKAVQHFVEGLFRNQQFSIGDIRSKVHFIVNSVECLPEPSFTGIDKFRCLSPLCVSQKREIQNHTSVKYLSPDDDGYAQLLFANLINKYLAYYHSEKDYNKDQNIVPLSEDKYTIKILSKPKSRLITIKAHTPQETKIRGFEFDFLLTAPIELIRFAYAAGLGEKNSVGFGCIENINQTTK